MATLISLAAFLLILGILVFVHELGHFLVAKKVGMRVDEFALGFPPRLFARQKGETLYALNAIPFGGYVKIYGEGPSEDGDDPRAFGQKSVWARMAVMVAGVVMNIILAFVLLTVAFSVGFTSIGQDLSSTPGAKVTQAQLYVAQVFDGTPALRAGLQPGDKVHTVVAGSDTYEIKSASDLQRTTANLRDAGRREVSVNVVREGAATTLNAVLAEQGPPLGVAIQDVFTVRLPVHRAAVAAVKEIGLIGGFTWDSLKGFAGRLVKNGELDPNVTGPVGIYRATATATQQGFGAVIFLMVALSVNLALLNILPIPSLDGGKLLVLIIEAIARRRVIPHQLESIVSVGSFFLLMALIVVLSVRDLIRF